LKKVILVILIILPLLNIYGQSLPGDLQAAVEMNKSGVNQNQLDMMINYPEIRTTRLQDIYERRDELTDLIDKNKKNKKTRNIIKWSTLITGVLATGSFTLFSLLANDQYDNYMETSITADALEFKESFQTFDLISYISLGVAGASTGVSTFTFLYNPSLEKLEKEQRDLINEIQLLEGELQ